MGLKNTIQSKITQWLQLRKYPHLKLYEGFGNENHITLMGHTLLRSPQVVKYDKKGWLSNSFSLLRLFMVKAMAGATVSIHWQGSEYETVSGTDGFFRFDLKNHTKINPGRHAISVKLIDKPERKLLHKANGHIIIPHINQFSFISDIDDTFLISHSSKLLKRLYVLLTKNANSRKPFERVAQHYQALQLAQTKPEKPNPFFYISSSEWNLYDYIHTFIEKNHLPRGVCLLNQMKSFGQVFETGQNNHSTKFTRIARVLSAYPTQRFVLLGDDTQQDSSIYADIVSNFPSLIHSVYIRSVKKKRKAYVEEKLKEISDRNIPVCYFTHSADAVKHSKEIGLIN